MAKKRISPLSIFIACEGSNTEPLYFEKLNEIMEDEENYPFAITVYPDKNNKADKYPKTDALGLINVAIERKNYYDELWVVFDKDGYTKHKEAFELAKVHNINIAFSSISFELWVLLHFEKCSIAFSKSAQIISEKFHKNESYLVDYAKSGDFSVYPLLKAKIDNAFKNASWLRNWLSMTYSNYVCYEVNPYCNVDYLVKRLLLDDFVYEYRTIGQRLVFDGVEIEVKIIKNEYVVCVENKSNRSLVWNEFIFQDSLMNRVNVVNSVIFSGDQSEVILGQINGNQNITIEFKNLKLEVSSALS